MTSRASPHLRLAIPSGFDTANSGANPPQNSTDRQCQLVEKTVQWHQLFLYVLWCSADHSVSLTRWRVHARRYAKNDRVMPQQKSIGVMLQQIGAVEHQMPALNQAVQHLVTLVRQAHVHRAP